MMTCSPVAPASPRRLLCLQLRWRTIAMSTCSVAAPKSNFLLLRLENTRLHIESRKQELVRLRTTLFLICSIPPEAHSLERRLSTRRTISAIPIRLYSRRILCTSTSKRSNLRIFVDYPPRHPISISIMAALSSHASNSNIHITSYERTAWNAKAPGTHVGDATHITAAERTAWNAKAAKPTGRILTLSASGWDGDSKTQTTACSNVSATETAQLITPVPALASQTAYYEAGILCTGKAANSLTFTATTVPTENLVVYVVIQAL